MSEFLGFLVILFVLFFPLIRKALIRKQQPQQKPPSVENEEPTDEELPPLPPPRFPSHPQHTFDFHTDLETRQLKGNLKQKKSVPKKREVTYLKKVLQAKKPEQAMVILSTIYERPPW